jgi:ATP-dependent exoDNAse (exonuclease V) beta subunit
LDARIGQFWSDLIERLPDESDADVECVDADTLPQPTSRIRTPDLRALALAEGGDALAARWEAERRELLKDGAWRPFAPIAVTDKAYEEAPPRVEPAGAALGGLRFGRLVHEILEWIPLDADDPQQMASGIAAARAPLHGLSPEQAAEAGAAVARVLASPVLERARVSSRVLRELKLWFPDGEQLLEGQVDLVFEEQGALVVVDYKTEPISDEQALVQAAHHAPQLQIYGRGLAQATGFKVRERLVLFTALGRAVPV